MEEADSEGELGEGVGGEHVAGADARREGGAADESIAVEADAGLDEEAVVGRPAILNVGAVFDTVLREIGRGAEDDATGERAVLAEEGDGAAQRMLRVVDAVDIDAELEIVAAGETLRGQKQVGDGLDAPGGCCGGAIEVAAGGFGRDEVHGAAEGERLVAEVEDGGADFEQHAAREIVLVLEGGEVGGAVEVGGGLLRIEQREGGVGLMKAVDEKAARKDVVR